MEIVDSEYNRDYTRPGVEHASRRNRMGEMKRKVPIPYHHDHHDEVGAFIRTLDEDRDVFIARGIGVRSCS